MSEMIERVAKALRDELQKIGYGVGTINASQLSDALARAAIEAMREPTDAMVEAGDIWADGPGYSVKVLDAMIDAALNEKSPATS